MYVFEPLFSPAHETISPIIEMTNAARARIACVHTSLCRACCSLMDIQVTRCLGATLRAGDVVQTPCEADFVPGQPHLQNKFCKVCCTTGFAVETTRIRVLAEGARKKYSNTTHEGFWCDGSGPVPYRVINQHARCTGPPLILFRNVITDEENQDWSPTPPEWVRTGTVWLRVAYGTLVPLGASRVAGPRKHRTPPAVRTTAVGPSASVNAPALNAPIAVVASAVPAASQAASPPSSEAAAAAAPFVDESLHSMSAREFVDSLTFDPLVYTLPDGLDLCQPAEPGLDMCAPAESSWAAESRGTGDGIDFFAPLGVAPVCAAPMTNNALSELMAPVPTGFAPISYGMHSVMAGFTPAYGSQFALIDGHAETSTATSGSSPTGVSEEDDEAYGIGLGDLQCPQLETGLSVPLESGVNTQVGGLALMAKHSTTPCNIGLNTHPAMGFAHRGQLPRPCATCRAAKILCDRLAPSCGRCERLGITCELPPTVKRGRPSHAEQAVRQQHAKKEAFSPHTPSAPVIYHPPSPPGSPPSSIFESWTPFYTLSRRGRLQVGLVSLSALAVLALLLDSMLSAYLPVDKSSLGSHTIGLYIPTTNATSEPTIGASRPSVAEAAREVAREIGRAVPTLALCLPVFGAFVVTSATTPATPPPWMLRYIHAVGALMVAVRAHSITRSYERYAAMDECDAARTARRVALVASFGGALARALATLYRRGEFFWTANRVLSAYNALVLLALVGVLWSVEQPATYPPGEQSLGGSLVFTMSLIAFPLVFTPVRRRRVASTVEEACAYSCELLAHRAGVSKA